MAYIPLTLQQEDIYFDHLLHQDTPVYNIGARVLIKGKIDISVFEAAYNEFVRQHDALRYLPVVVNDELFFRIAPVQTMVLPFMDFSSCADPEKEATEFITDDFAIPFEFSGAKPLFCLILLRLSETSFILYSKYHHVIVDGWGTSLLFKRLVQFYNELIDGSSPVSTFDYSYQEYIEFDRAYRQSTRFEQDRGYWKASLARIDEPLLEYSDKEVQPRSGRCVKQIARTQYDGLILFAETHHCSVFHVMLAALSIVMARFFQKKAFCVGVPVLNRSTRYQKQTVGLFMGVSPLHITLGEDDSLVLLMTNIRNQLREDYKHQRVPLSTIIRDLGLVTEKSKLFDITLSYERHDYADHFFDTETSVIPLSHFAERAGLAVYIREFDESGDVTIDFDYNICKLEKELVEQIVSATATLLENIQRCSGQSWTSAPLLNDQQLNRILFQFNETAFPVSPHLTVCDLIDAQCIQFPAAIAIDDGEQSITYGQLQEKVLKIASALKAKVGRQDGVRVGVLMTRSVNLILAQLGVLKAGMTFIPLDPMFPSDRIEYIIRHSEVSLIISSKNQSPAFNFSFISKLDIHDALLYDNDSRPRASIDRSKAAYVIYTSGSTGKPKGVEVSHGALVNFMVSMQRTPGISNQDTMFSVTTSSFDISILEFFLPLTIGARVFIARNEILSSVHETMQSIDRVRPTIIQATPSFYQMLFDAGWEGMENLMVLCGGDVLTEALAEKILISCAALWNMYGPTETTIWSAVKRIQYPNDARIVGRPIANTKLFILDAALNALPIGVKGRLFIGGEGLANGYLFQSEMTNERFVSNPFLTGQKFYDTGDIAMWNSSGEVIFFGRADNQVKVRGYRIELSEIERNIMLVDGVDQAVVIKKGDGANAFLVAYVRTGEQSIHQRIRNSLSLSLPDYMIPNAIVTIEQFPLTPNKKIDRKALSERPIESGSTQRVMAEEFIPDELKNIWKQVLSRDSVHGAQNFFELGGHSLKVVQMTALINRTFNTSITAADIFQFPTLQQLAALIATGNRNEMKLERVFRNGSHRPARNQRGLWIACQQHEVNTAYNMVGILKLDRPVDVTALEAAIEKLIRRSEALRLNFKIENGQPTIVVKVADACKFTLKQRFVSDAIEFDSVVDEIRNTRFHLESDLLLQGFIITSPEALHLAFISHHLVIDGESTRILLEQVAQHYTTTIDIETPFEYLDYAYFTNHNPQESQIRKFWQRELQGIVNASRIFKQKPVSHHAARHYHFSFRKNELSDFSRTVAALNVSEFSILLSALHLVIHRQFGLTNFCTGLAVNTRPQIDFSQVIGMFVNTLVCRDQISADDSFAGLIQRTALHVQQLLIYKEYSITDAMGDCKLSEVPFEVLVTFQEISGNVSVSFGDAVATVMPFPPAIARVPVAFSFSSTHDGVRCEVEYDAALFDELLIRLWCDRFKYLVTTIGSNITMPIHSIKLEDAEDTLTSLPLYDIQFNF